MNRNRKNINRKNVNKKRVMAGAMAAVVTAGSTGALAYQKPALEVMAKEETAEILEEAASSVLAGNEEQKGDTGEDKRETFKEESVYVKADTDGRISKTTVTEWIKNPEKGELADASGLKDIRNIKGDEEFTKGSGQDLRWESEGNDIYYQGTTDEKLPVDVNISYKLNGKAVSAKELSGKDGKVEIHIDYENHAKQNVEINGENVEMYTPFTMVTAMMLPADEYTNVVIDNGKIMSDADKNIVVGLGFPGLTENLKLEEADIDIPESVTITADVKDASVGGAVTVASAELMEEFDLSDVQDFNSLEDSIHELEDASGKLADGAEDAAAGAEALFDGTKEAASGAKELAGGSGTLSDGVDELNSKSGELISGVNELANGVTRYTSSVSELAQGSKAVAEGTSSVDEGAKKLKEGAQNARNGADGLAAGYQALDQSNLVNNAKAAAQGTGSALNEAKNYIGTADSILRGICEMSARAAAEPDIAGTEDAVQAIVSLVNSNDLGYVVDESAVRAAINSSVYAVSSEAGDNSAEISAAAGQALRALGGAEQYIDGANDAAGVSMQCAAGMESTVETLKAGTQQLQEGLGALNAGAETLAQGTAGLSAGAKTVADGAAALDESSSLLKIGTSKLQQGTPQLAEGVSRLAAGANQLKTGAGALSDGNQKLSDGAKALAEGNQELSDGMSEFKTSGIDRLTDVFDNDIQSVRSRIDVMSELGRNYRSFAGIKEDMNGSTKFIIETEGVK